MTAKRQPIFGHATDHIICEHISSHLMSDKFRSDSWMHRFGHYKDRFACKLKNQQSFCLYLETLYPLKKWVNAKWKFHFQKDSIHSETKDEYLPAPRLRPIISLSFSCYVGLTFQLLSVFAVFPNNILLTI